MTGSYTHEQLMNYLHRSYSSHSNNTSSHGLCTQRIQMADASKWFAFLFHNNIWQSRYEKCPDSSTEPYSHLNLIPFELIHGINQRCQERKTKLTMVYTGFIPEVWNLTHWFPLCLFDVVSSKPLKCLRHVSHLVPPTPRKKLLVNG